MPGWRCYQAGSLVPEDLPQEWSAAGRDDEVIWRVLELAYQRFFVDTTLQDYRTRMSRVLSEVLGGDEKSD
ncbi:hypothetical protein GCM10023074_58510 [Microbispora amethystogenes]|uniref:Uncharacterized protein n=1 Tax=Microbispora amethystogenes TaxID=1427754 RepID=A0ABQ4FIT5_9ACTN|nr:hypothetical protein Mam01_48740 [Microbispora amethystogenes]